MPGSDSSTPCEDREIESAKLAASSTPQALSAPNQQIQPREHQNNTRNHQQEKAAPVSPPPVDLSISTENPPPATPNPQCLRILDRRGSSWSLELAGLESPSPTTLLSKLTASNSPPAPPALDNQVAFAVRSSSSTSISGQREAESYFINWQNWHIRKSGSISEHSRRRSYSSVLRRGSSFLDDISPAVFSTTSSTSVASCSAISLSSSSSTTVTTPGLGSGRNPTLFLLSPTTLFPTSSSTTALAEMANGGIISAHGQNLPRVVNMRLQLPPNALSSASVPSSDGTHQQTHHHHHPFANSHIQNQHFPASMCTPDRDAPEPSMENLLANECGRTGGGGGGRKDSSCTGLSTLKENSPGPQSRKARHQLSGSMALLTPPEEASLVWKLKEVSISAGPTTGTSESTIVPRRLSATGIKVDCSEGGKNKSTGFSIGPASTSSTEGSLSGDSLSVGDNGDRPGLNQCGDGTDKRTDSSGSSSSEKTVKDGSSSQSDDTEPEVQKWLADALEKMFEPGIPVQGTMEAVRVLSFTNPCPISFGDPNPESSMYLRQQDRLPASAQSAPAVAAAANRQLSPVVVARCSTRTSQPSTLPFRGLEPTGIITATYDLVTSIQERFADETQRTYVQVFHAISPLFPLNRVAGTPPPAFGAHGRAATGEIPSYFSPSVFNSIVMAHPPTPGPSSSIAQPNPILPPSSLHYTLFERYIPPATAEEDRNMFSGASSILSDRICELSDHNGSLLFIYPTKAGAKTFLDNYLGPVLDPLLRKYMVLYRLRDSLLWKIRHMAAVEHLRPFEQLEDELKRFCHGRAEVVYSEKKTVQLEDVAWREWWVEQEAERIRACFKSHTSMPLPTRRYTHNSAGSPEVENRENGFIQGYGAPGDLAREILDSVRIVSRQPSSRAMGEAVLASSVGIEGALGSTVSAQWQQHIEGIEVGVFVLRKTSGPE